MTNMTINLLVAAAGIKLLTFVADSYLAQMDPSGSFTNSISPFIQFADLIFYGLVIMALVLIPYNMSKKKNDDKKKTPNGKQ